MNKVSFPGLNLNFEISNIAFKIGNIEIYWYGIFIVSAFIIGLILCKKDDGKYKINFSDILELSIYTIPVSIICARIYYVVFNANYFINNPIKILEIRDGGLAIYGGIIGAIISVSIYCIVKKINILDMMDYIVPVLPLGQAIGRLGNFVNIEAYGKVATNIFRMGIIENGTYIEVHPTFLYEAICNLILFICLYVKRNKRSFRGEKICIYFIGYGLARSIIEELRVDSLMLGNIRVSQLLSIILFIISSLILVYKLVKNKLKQ